MSRQTANTTEQESGVELKKPREYAVILYNDDYTPIDFVVLLLMKIFKKSPTEAYAIAQQIHTQDKGIAGIYSYDIAETKMNEVLTLSEQNEYPLECKMEPV